MIASDRFASTISQLGLDGLQANVRCILSLGQAPREVCRRALAEVSAALAAEPSSAELCALKGRILSHQQRYREAKDCLERSLILNPRHERARSWLGQIHLLETRFQQAVRELSAGLRRNPDDHWAVFHRAASYYALRRHASARKDLRRIMNKNAGEPKLAAQLFTSLLDMESGDYAGALRGLLPVIRSRPGEPWPLALRARLHRLMGRLDLAGRDMERSVNGSAPGWVYEERASLHDARGNSSEALQDLSRALRFNPARPDILLRQFDLHRRMGRWDRAAAAFSAALKMPGGLDQSRGMLFDIAEKLKSAKELRSALALGAVWLKRRRGDTEVAGLLSRWREHLRRIEKGFDQENPDLSAARGELVNELGQQGRLGEAEKLIKEDLAAGRRWKGAAGALADLLWRQGKLRETAEFLKQLSRPDLRDAQVQLVRAGLSLSAGDHSAARRHLRSAVKTDPGNLRARTRWAELELQAGRWSAARGALGPKTLWAIGAAARSWDVRERLRGSLLRCDSEAVVAWAERLLDATVTPADIDLLRRPVLMSDFEFMAAPEDYRAAVERSVSAYQRRHPRSPWGPYYRLVLNIMTQRSPGPVSGLRAILAAPARRYGWMRYEAGVALAEHDLAAAEREFKIAARFGAIPDWRALCRLSETRICLGDEIGSRQALARAERAVPAGDRKDFLAWKGEILLWAGRYRESLESSDRALQAGSELAPCWKGGALVCLGRWKEALDVLNKPGAGRPQDREHRLWKAEACYRLGLTQAALEAIPVQYHPPAVDIYVAALKGLCLGRQGDEHGVRAEFSKLDVRLRAYLREKTGIRADSVVDLLGLLEALLKISRGVRRTNYETSAWMR